MGEYVSGTVKKIKNHVATLRIIIDQNIHGYPRPDLFIALPRTE
jgi:hypothetical protein